MIPAPHDPNKRPFTCEVCGKALSSAAILHVHMRVHLCECILQYYFLPSRFFQLRTILARIDSNVIYATSVFHKGQISTSTKGCICVSKSTSTQLLKNQILLILISCATFLDTFVLADDDPRKKAFECGTCHKFFVEKNDCRKHERIHLGMILSRIFGIGTPKYSQPYFFPFLKPPNSRDFL